MSTVRQGVILQRSVGRLGVSDGICRGDDCVMLFDLRVFLQSKDILCVRWDHLLLNLPAIRVHLYPRGGWERKRVGQRENGCQSLLHLRVWTGC